MSFTKINHMRSTRFPFSGLGCGCSAPMSGMGQLTVTAEPGTVIGVSALGLFATGLGLWWYFSQKPARVSANRRRARRSRRHR
jgi:hypothetical protein